MDRPLAIPRRFVIAAALGILVATALMFMRSVSLVHADDAVALATCNHAVVDAEFYGLLSRVERAQRTTAAEVVRLQEGRSTHFSVTSAYRRLPADAIATVCLFSGQFNTPAGPPRTDGTVPAVATRLRLIVLDDGTSSLDSAGQADGMGPETPADLGTVPGS
jgi:hypothetical protein